MSAGSKLRQKAYGAVRAGKLPYRPPARIWGGPGDGACCAICDKPVERDEMEYELEFARGRDGSGADNPHVHVQCFLAWERAGQKFEAPQERSVTPLHPTGGGSASGSDSAGSDGGLPKASDERMIGDHGLDTTPGRGPL